MFKKLSQNKKAQQTAEYAILIALVVGAVIAMQTYAQRTIQARIRGASVYLSQVNTSVLGTDAQYEPYYIDSAYDVTRNELTTETQVGNIVRKDADNLKTRDTGGRQTTTWNGAGAW